jgi:hypothetical protein
MTAMTFLRHFPRRTQHRGNFNRMMAVVIKYRPPLCSPVRVKRRLTPAFQAVADIVVAQTKLMGHGHRSGRIQRVVVTRHLVTRGRDILRRLVSLSVIRTEILSRRFHR